MKNTWKKVLFTLGAISLLGAGSIGLVNAQAAGDTYSTDTKNGMATQNNQYTIGGRRVGEAGDNTLLQNAIKLVNRVMSMLSVVALVVLLIGGYRMITANGDEGKYKKGLSVLKQAAIGLVVIGLSWAIIRIIFRFINRSDDTTATYDK